MIWALAGCSATPPPPATAPVPTALPEAVTVEFVQARSDVAPRQAQVQITNGTDEPLHVGPVAVTDPRFDGEATRVRDQIGTIAAGATVGVRVQLPPMACADDIPDEAESVVTFDYTLGESTGTAEAPLPDPLRFVPGLHARECRAAALADVADLSFTEFAPSAPGETADLVLTVSPTGAGDARITGIQTTNLLTFGPATDGASETRPLDVAMAAGDTTATEVRLPLVPFRCDPHVVQEDKRGTIFTLEVQLDGAAQEIELAAPADMRGRMLTWVADWCRFGE